MARRKRSSSPISLFSFQDIITSVTGIMILITLMLALEVIQKKENGPDAQSRQLASDAQRSAEEIAQRIESNKQAIEQMRHKLQQTTQELTELAQFDADQLRRQATDLNEVSTHLSNELQKSSAQRAAATKRAQQAKEAKDRRASDPQTLAETIIAAKEKTAQLEQMKKSGRMIFSPTEGDEKAPWLVEIDENRIAVAEVGKEAPPQSFATPDQFFAWAGDRNPSREYFVLLVKPGGIKHFGQIQDDLLNELGFDVGYDVLPSNQTALDPRKGAAF
jgi:hypothetical protein